MRVRSRAGLGVALAFGASCGGCGDDVPRVITEVEVCTFDIRDIELDDAGTRGVAPLDMLELASGPFTEPLVWNEPEREFPFGPESGTGSVTFEVLDVGSRARWYDLGLKPGEDGECPDWIEVPIVLGVRSAGGALDERLSTWLVATEPIVATEPMALGTYVEIDPNALDGSFAFEPGATDGGRMELILDVQFGEGHASGRLEAMFTPVDESDLEWRHFELANFPAEGD